MTTFNAGNKFPLRLRSQKPISPRHRIPPQSDHENYERTKSLEILCCRKQPSVRTSFGPRVTILSSPIAYYVLYNYRTIKLEKYGGARAAKAKRGAPRYSNVRESNEENRTNRQALSRSFCPDLRYSSHVQTAACNLPPVNHIAPPILYPLYRRADNGRNSYCHPAVGSLSQRQNLPVPRRVTFP